MTGLSVQLVLYAATVLGAAAMVLLLPSPRKPGGTNWKPLGALLGAATLGGVWLILSPLWGTRPASLGDAASVTGLDAGAFPFYYVFSLIGIVAAVRVITHHRPVYAALWFVLVILSSAGLFLVLSAEFMALALVIIYGGAILVTYMFVIMLASQPQASDAPEDTPDYERYAKEPLWASVAGFLLLAVLLTFIFDPNNVRRNPEAMGPYTDQQVAELILPDRARIASVDSGGDPILINTPVGNVERVGLDLFMANPLAIELAGVILLLSLIGAVVIAKTDLPGTDDVNDDPAVRAAVDPKPAPAPSANA